MRRRALLATLTSTTAVLGGCLEAGPGSGSETPDGTPTAVPEQCDRLVLSIDRLPERPREEVRTALEEGRYITDGPLYLTRYFDGYLEAGRGEWYSPEVTETDGETVLTLEETVPSRGSHDLVVENRTTEAVDVTVRVERLRDDRIVLDESVSVPGGSEDRPGTAETASFERLFSEYRATVETGSRSATVSWVHEFSTFPLDTLVVGPDEIRRGPQAVMEPVDCSYVWGTD